MTRLNALLLVLLVMSSLYLVQTSYESRRLFAELERQRSQAQKLAQEAERLQVERRDQATHLRVERVAREQLGMRPAAQGGNEYVRDKVADEKPDNSGGGTQMRCRKQGMSSGSRRISLAIEFFRCELR